MQTQNVDDNASDPSSVIILDDQEVLSSTFCVCIVSAFASSCSFSCSFSSFTFTSSSLAKDFSSVLSLSFFFESSSSSSASSASSREEGREEEDGVGDGVVSPKYAARFFSASASMMAPEFS